MPTKRRRVAREVQFVYGETTLEHLRHGDCLLVGNGLGCYCGLVDAAGQVRVDLVRQLWQEHREEIVDGCAEPWAASV